MLLARDLIWANWPEENGAYYIVKGDLSMSLFQSLSLTRSPPLVTECASPIARNHHRHHHNEADPEWAEHRDRVNPGSPCHHAATDDTEGLSQLYLWIFSNLT